MALVSCVECGHSVSDAAGSCPQCGHPVNKAAAALATTGVAAVPARPGAEEVLWQGTPSLRMLLGQAIRTVVFVALPIVGVALAYQPLSDFLKRLADGAADKASAYAAGLRLAVILFAVTAVGVPLARLAWQAISLRHHRYRLSNQRLTVETGVITKTLVDVDMRTVDDITFHQGVLDRLLKLGRIEIISSEAGGAAGRNTHLVLTGISEPRAVRETIRNAAYQATHSQLFTRST